MDEREVALREALRIAEEHSASNTCIGKIRALLTRAAIDSRADEAKAMFIARLENMHENNNRWLTVQAVLALLNDCDRCVGKTQAQLMTWNSASGPELYKDKP